MTEVDHPTLTAEQARTLTDQIKVAVEGTWLLIQEAYVSRGWAVLGYASWDDYCTREFGASRLRLPREERQEVVASLREIGMSTRAIGAATGMSYDTVQRDLRAGDRNLSPAVVNDLTSGVGNPTPAPQVVGNQPPAPRAVHGTSETPAPTEVVGMLPIGNTDPFEPGPAQTPVIGMDGKTYPTRPTSAVGDKPTPPKPAAPVDRRGPLGDELLKIAIELHRLTNRIDRIRGDDRFNRNTHKIAIRLRPDLRRAVLIYQDLLDALPDTTTEDTTT